MHVLSVIITPMFTAARPLLLKQLRMSGASAHCLCSLVLLGLITVGATVGAQVKPGTPPERLLSGLRNKDPQNRKEAANELGAIRARGAVRALVETLSDKEPIVREAAAFAL